MGTSWECTTMECKSLCLLGKPRSQCGTYSSELPHLKGKGAEVFLPQPYQLLEKGREMCSGHQFPSISAYHIG